MLYICGSGDGDGDGTGADAVGNYSRANFSRVATC